jgi:tetratricopeptide (TPR) repeat protein
VILEKLHIIKSFNKLLLLLFWLMVHNLFAQQEKKEVYKGNKLYDNRLYNLAEKSYLHALEKNAGSTQAMFNLGDAYYKQNKFSEAAEQFQMLTHKPLSKDTMAKAYHNLGNALLQQKKYQDAVDAYKQALKNDPNDADTRYNLAYAQQMLKKEQQNKNNKDDKDNKDNKDKKDNKDNKKDKDNKNDKDNKKDKNDKNDKENNDKKEPEQNQLSKEDAQRLLDALLNDEKKLQESKKIKKEKGQKVVIEKDW